MGNSELMALRALTIFETASDVDEQHFIGLLQATSMAPLDTDPSLLRGSGLIIAGSRHEAAVMEDRLGVLMLSHTELLQECIFPRYRTLVISH